LTSELLGKRDYLLFRDATTTSASEGYRLTACTSGSYSVSQADARLVSSVDDFRKIMTKFTNQGDNEVIKSFLHDLHKIKQCILASNIFSKYDFVGTSLLFLYSPDNGKTAVRWIDFANVTQPVSSDRNGVVHGIDQLSNLLKSLLVHED